MSWKSSSSCENTPSQNQELTQNPHLEKTTLAYDPAVDLTIDPDGRCPEKLERLVPGDAAWQQSMSSYNSGDYGEATLSFGAMLGEQALTVATFGMGSAAVTVESRMAAGVAEEVIGGLEVGNSVENSVAETRDIIPYSGQVTPNSWPLNSGFLGNITKTELQIGTLIDRYGLRSGTYVAPKGTPFISRGLPAALAKKFTPESYELLQPLKVKTGLSAPGFDFPGLGIQYELPLSVQELIDTGVLKPK